ncbi:hypothetical protein [Candidatus Phytoplasma sp. AldY-WA1]|uniref:hypothetical protein n=1 Tax=Candidatus Phytoplasma sp. AldY-WA1 TaxID=2852100 RepID=UPI00254FF27B|nr:hypothetical protein [Candidatus Phytoplasma sp. AldY-WA1]
MTLRSFLALCGIGIVVIFTLYLFGYITPNKENLPFMVEKQPKVEKKTTTTPGTTTNSTPGK